MINNNHRCKLCENDLNKCTRHKETLNVTLSEKDIKKELINIIKKDKLHHVVFEPRYADNSSYVIGSIIVIHTQWMGEKNGKN